MAAFSDSSSRSAAEVRSGTLSSSAGLISSAGFCCVKGGGGAFRNKRENSDIVDLQPAS